MRSLYIRSSSLACVRDFIKDCGGDAEALFEEVELDFDPQHAENEFCSFHKAIALHEIAAQTLGRENFGLELALTLPPDYAHFSPFVYLAYFEKDARSWFQSAVQFQSMFTNAHRPELYEFPERSEARIRLHTEMQMILPRQWREFQMAGVYMLVKDLINAPEALPRVVRMRHARPDDASLHQQIFGTKVEFGCSHDEFVFDRKLLDLKLRGRARYLRPLIGLYMSRKMRNAPQLDLSVTGSVRLYLQCVLGMGKNSIEDAAQAVGTSVKKLQRDLAEDGTSYSQILDELRRKKAMYLLRTPDLKVRKIAAMLDYSATAAFSLAFKRWTGMSPKAYRDVVRENHEMLDLK